ncbi:hypothetical protein DESC_380009 [Desulfosarcina cetonica]|nr:hypothetical protein DESC_380009 [Desulfosarcina cetonica]
MPIRSAAAFISPAKKRRPDKKSGTVVLKNNLMPFIFEPSILVKPGPKTTVRFHALLKVNSAEPGFLVLDRVSKVPHIYFIYVRWSGNVP